MVIESIVIGFFLIFNSAAQLSGSVEAVPLQVENLQVDGTTVQFDLWNRSDRSVSAYLLSLRYGQDGKTDGLEEGQDFAISAFLKDGAPPEHRVGLLDPGEFDRKMYPLGASPASNPIEVTVKTVVFSDNTVWGDSVWAEGLFRERQEALAANEAILDELRAIRGTGSPREDLEAMARQLRSGVLQFPEGHSDLPPMAASQRARLNALQMVDAYLKIVERGEIPASRLLQNLFTTLENQRQALGASVP